MRIDLNKDHMLFNGVLFALSASQLLADGGLGHIIIAAFSIAASELLIKTWLEIKQCPIY